MIQTDVIGLPDELARLYWKVYLDLEQLRNDLAYEAATSFCDDCPRRNWEDYVPQSYSELEFGIHIAESCCKEQDNYQESSWQYEKRGQDVLKAIKEFLGNDADDILNRTRENLTR